jgi:hypothetical protein
MHYNKFYIAGPYNARAIIFQVIPSIGVMLGKLIVFTFKLPHTNTDINGVGLITYF